MWTSRSAQTTQRVDGRQAVASRLAAFVTALALSGCAGGIEGFYDSKLSLDQPVDWWHQLQGGPIANERPPPPGITEPYPNLASVPPKPVPTDAATRAGLTAQLAGQRDRARLLAAQDPVVFPTPALPRAPAVPAPSATPASPAGNAPAATPAATAPADDAPSTMTLEAASPPAAPAVRAAPAPSNDLAAPAAFRTPPASSGPVISGPIPPLPTAAPPLPNLPGLPTAEPAPVVDRPRPQTSFAFAPGSAALPPAADEALRALAVRASGGPIAISAGGDAASTALAAQAAALPLALRRTGAMAASLIAAGVKTGSIQAEATAPGREASARLVD